MKDHPTPAFALPQDFELKSRIYLGLPRTQRNAPAPTRPSDPDRPATVEGRRQDQVPAQQRWHGSIFAHGIGARLDMRARATGPEHDSAMFDDQQKVRTALTA